MHHSRMQRRAAAAPDTALSPPLPLVNPSHPTNPHRNRNFLYSLIAGATVLGGIAGAVTFVSNFDPVKRG